MLLLMKGNCCFVELIAWYLRFQFRKNMHSKPHLFVISCLTGGWSFIGHWSEQLDRDWLLTPSKYSSTCVFDEKSLFLSSSTAILYFHRASIVTTVRSKKLCLMLVYIMTVIRVCFSISSLDTLPLPHIVYTEMLSFSHKLEKPSSIV